MDIQEMLQEIVRLKEEACQTTDLAHLVGIAMSIIELQSSVIHLLESYLEDSIDDRHSA